MTIDKINEQLAICNKATPGPWEWTRINWNDGEPLAPSEIIGVTDFEMHEGSGMGDEDAEFCAEARTGWPEALKELAEAKATIERLTHELAAVEGIETTLAEARAKLLQAESYRRVTAHLIATRMDGECGDIDGCSIQDLLEKEGILEMVTATESCGDGCPCAEFGFPTDCYHLTDVGKAARGAHEEENQDAGGVS